MKISKECELGNFYIGLESMCESCGYVPNEIVWSDGDTWYCLDCARYLDEFEEPTEEMLKELNGMIHKKLYGVRWDDSVDGYGVCECGSIEELFDMEVLGIFVDKEIAQDYVDMLGSCMNKSQS